MNEGRASGAGTEASRPSAKGGGRARDLLGLRYSRGPHIEGWSLKLNDPSGRRAAWLRTTVLAPAPRDGREAVALAETWAVTFDRDRGHVATKSTVPLASARFASTGLDLEVDGCTLRDGEARGAVASGDRAIAWDLAIGASRAAPVMHLPAAALYAERVPGAKLATPISDAPVDGHISVTRGGGSPAERWDIAGWSATLSHDWGPAHARLHAWVHCSAWDAEEGLVFEAVSGRVRMGPVPLLSPMATAIFVRYRGEVWDLNGREILGGNRGTVSQRSWECVARGKGIEVRADVGAETDDFVGLHEPNPTGSMSYVLSTRLARARVELTLPRGRVIVATSRAAALELGTRDPHHGVRMYL